MGKPEKENIGKRIAELRASHKPPLTQTQLGEALGNYGTSTVDNWEHNRALKPEIIIALSKYFSVSTDWLLTGAETKELGFTNEIGIYGEAIDVLKSDQNLGFAISSLLTLNAGEIIKCLYQCFYCDPEISELYRRSGEEYIPCIQGNNLIFNAMLYKLNNQITELRKEFWGE